MSDTMACKICIGGPLTSSQLNHIENAEQWDTFNIVADHEDHTDNEVTLEYFEARMGVMEDFEGWLMSQNIPFDRYSDGKYEYGPEVKMFRPETATDPMFDEILETNVNQIVTVTREKLIDVIAGALGLPTATERWLHVMQELNKSVGLHIARLPDPYLVDVQGITNDSERRH